MYRKVFGSFIALAVFTTGCQQNDALPEKQETTPADHLVLVSQDSITTGSYNGIEIAAEAQAVYPAIQHLEGVKFVNVVSNISSSLAQLDGRIPLYQYILLDERSGTDTGVQITFESGLVKSIYLNSGRKLSKWPSGVAGDAPVKIGDRADALLMKFARIQNSPNYAKKFERVMLLTKDMSTSYDALMRNSPQWYFRYESSPGLYKDIRINLAGGKVSSIEVRVYKEM